MNQPAKPRRFRYSLRTLFVLMTVVAVLGWLGWNAKQVRERRVWLASLRARGAMFGSIVTDEAPKSLPPVWSLMGAEPVRLVDVPAGAFTPDDLARIATLFPEATIREDAGRLDLPVPRLQRMSPNTR